MAWKRGSCTKTYVHKQKNRWTVEDTTGKPYFLKMLDSPDTRITAIADGNEPEDNAKIVFVRMQHEITPPTRRIRRNPNIPNLKQLLWHHQEGLSTKADTRRDVWALYAWKTSRTHQMLHRLNTDDTCDNCVNNSISTSEGCNTLDESRSQTCIVSNYTTLLSQRADKSAQFLCFRTLGYAPSSKVHFILVLLYGPLVTPRGSDSLKIPLAKGRF